MHIKPQKNTQEKILQWLLPVVVCFIGLHFTTLGICGYDLSRIPGDLGDARFNMYLLEHGFQFITGKVQHFWDAPAMFPAQNVLAFSDNLLGSMPVYSLFRFLSFDRETSFQLWIIAMSVLNFTAAFYVLRKLTCHFVLACAGAYVFAFSIFLYTQFNHAQMFPRFIIPFVFYWLIKFFETFRLKYFFLSIAGVYINFIVACTSVFFW